MDREQTIANAKIWLETHTPLRWTTEAVGVEKGYSLDELNARCDRRAEQLADFHIAMSAERDAENDKLWEALDKFKELLNRN